MTTQRDSCLHLFHSNSNVMIKLMARSMYMLLQFVASLLEDCITVAIMMPRTQVIIYQLLCTSYYITLPIYSCMLRCL